MPGSTGTSFGAELTFGNLAATVECNPHMTGLPGTTAGLWLSSGSEAILNTAVPVYPGSTAIGVVSNGSTWAKGIVFGYNSLTPAPTTGILKAMQLPEKAEIQWTFDTSGARSSFIRCDAATASPGILFHDGSFNVVDSAEAGNLLQVTNGAMNATVGLSFLTAPASATDLSRHINLAFGNCGMNVYNGVLNFNVTGGSYFAFLSGGTPVAYVGQTGILTGGTALQIGAGGPTWTTGSAVPSATQPVGSLYSRVGGAVGATLYVSRGSGAWNPVAAV